MNNLVMLLSLTCNRDEFHDVKFCQVFQVCRDFGEAVGVAHGR